MSSIEKFENDLKQRKDTFLIFSIIGGSNFFGCFVYFVLHHSLTVLLIGIIVGGICFKAAHYERVRIKRLEFTLNKKYAE